MQITPIEFNKTKSSQKKKGKSGKEGGRGGGCWWDWAAEERVEIFKKHSTCLDKLV